MYISEQYPVHYVGSMYPGYENVRSPLANDIDALAACIAPFDAHPQLLSHVAVGERRHAGYVQPTVEHLAQQLQARGEATVTGTGPDDGSLWKRMDQRPRIRMARDAQLRPGDLDYANLAIDEREAFEILRTDRRSTGTWHESWRFQYSVPSPASLDAVALGPRSTNPLHVIDMVRSAAQMLKHYNALHDATVQEVERIHQHVPPTDSVAQVEITTETLATVMADRLGMGGIVAAKMGNLVAQFISDLPPEVAVDIHACTGSLNNRAEVGMKTLRPFVQLINEAVHELGERDPARQLLHVHCPVAPSDAPAPTNSAYYAPLSELRVPDNFPPYQLYAGLANRHQTLTEQKDALHQFISYTPEQFKVGISTSCGMGRYDRYEGQEVHANLVRIALGQTATT